MARLFLMTRASRGPSDRGSVATSMAAAVLLAASVMTGIYAVGLPEQVACAMDKGVTQATGTSAEGRTASSRSSGGWTDAEACDGERGQTGQASSEEDAEPPATTAAELGLTARTDTKWVRAFEGCTPNGAAVCLRAGRLVACFNDGNGPTRTCDEPTRVPLASLENCAPVATSPGLAPNRTSQSLCLVRLQGRDEPVVVRCTSDRDGVYTDETARCTDTAHDERASIDPSASTNLVSACQPLEAADSKDDTVTLEWACVAWSGELWSCTSTHTGSDTTDLEALAASAGGRAQSCDSRTFGENTLDCDPPDPTGRAICTTRRVDVNTLPTLNCALFPADPAVQATSNVYGKAMHCRTVTSTTPPTCSGGEGGAPEPVHGRGLRSLPITLFCSGDRADARVLDAEVVPGSNFQEIIVSAQLTVTPDGTATSLGSAGGVSSPEASLAAGHVQAIEAFLSGLTQPEDGAPVGHVPTVIIGSHHSMTSVLNYQPVAIFLNSAHADSLFVIAHEAGHAVAAWQGMGGEPADWQGQAVNEGFADAFAWLVATSAGEPTSFLEPGVGVLNDRTRGRVSYGQVDARRGEYHNGTLVVGVVQALWVHLAGDPSVAGGPGWTPAAASQLVGQLLVNAAAHPTASEGFFGFQQALIESAPALGIPAHVVEAAFADQEWPVLTGSCSGEAGSTSQRDDTDDADDAPVAPPLPKLSTAVGGHALVGPAC